MKEEPIHFVIPGDPIVKKNTLKKSVFYRDKNNILRARVRPITYYSQAYKQWAKEAINSCMILHNKLSAKGYQLPLDGTYILKCIFYMSRNTVVDLSALYEGVQDVLTGNAGVYQNTVASRLYQIIADDSCRFIIGHDGSRVAYDYSNPRTEVTIIPVNLFEKVHTVSNSENSF